MTDLAPALRGGLYMMGAAASFTIMTALIRVIAQEIHPFEIGFFRTITNLILMIPFVLRTGPTVFQTENHKVYALRGLIGVAFVMSYFSGAAMIPVSDSQALIFTSPLFAAALVVVFLGEKIRGRRMVALGIGFLGAMIILRPGFDAINLGAVLVLIGAMTNGASNALVKYTTRKDHPDTAVLFLMLYVTPLIALPTVFVWVTPSWEQLGFLLAIGFFATLNQRFLSRAFAAADATAVLPYDFSRLPFAALIGWFVFSELPDFWVWVGGAIIFAASIYIAHRESLASRREID
ncbi:MAG: DMT family transporter [Alphaproteobacteria bacterium]